MSGIQIGRSRPYIAGADLSSNQYCFVKQGSTQNTVVLATAATDDIIGILENAPKSGWEAKVVLFNAQGTMSILAGGSIGANVKITCNGSGRATSTINSGDFVLGTTVDAATANGDVIEIVLSKYKN